MGFFLFIRPYIVNLLPYIARICRREEEAVQETLSNSMPKICSALMAFANDSEVKVGFYSIPRICYALTAFTSDSEVKVRPNSVPKICYAQFQMGLRLFT